MAINPFSTLVARIYAAALVAALTVAAVQTVRIDGLWFINGLEQKLSDARQSIADEAAAHQQTKDDYRAAQAEAARLDAERITREKARQQEINDAASKDYAASLAALRARYQRLLDNAKAGSPAGGAAGNVAVSGLSTAPGGTAGAADLRLAGAAGECLTPAERLMAAEQAAQLDALILAVERLSGKIGAPTP